MYEVLSDSLSYYLKKYNALLPAYVFMPSHIHLLIALEGRYLAGFMRDFKKYTSQHSLPSLGIHEMPIWESGYDRVEVHSEDVFRTKLEYIHNNPVKAGLVEATTEWKWSSAADYFSEKTGHVPVWKDWTW